MHYIDAHCHLADPRFNGQLEQVLKRAQDASISRFIQGGVHPQDWQRQLQLADERWICAFGLHPWFVAESSDAVCQEAFQQLVQELPKVPVLGELGLDFSRRCPETSKARQIHFFREQLALAKDHCKPVVLHLVGSYGQALPILSKFAPLRGLVHGFTGSKEVALQLCQYGLLISVGGGVARDGFKKLKDALPYVPSDRLVVESDAPDMAPAAYPRPLNEPDSLHLVAAKIAERRGESPDTILARSTQNLIRAFQLEPLS